MSNERVKGILLNRTQSVTGQMANRGGVIRDHRLLEHRNEADQHPISSITGLEEFVDAFENGFILNCGSSTEVI